jgi:tetratricopeptide (TPR) repeat protein
MSISTTRGSLVTFYSWKGGVGRTMALANIAIQLARLGRSVLMVDWDLEAPGLLRYFAETGDLSKAEGSIAAPADPTGLMGLLHDATQGEFRPPERRDWETRLRRIQVPCAPTSFRMLCPPTPGRFDMLPSGHGSENYAARIGAFSWDRFFAEHRGGEWLEELRGQWATTYDFVLIDSRTGLTDSGGVCTVQMPDILVLVFTANDQCLADGLAIVEAAQRNRATFAYDRAPLAVVPLLSRWCGDEEVDTGETWMRRFNKEVRPLVSAWLPLGFEPRQFLEKTRIPHVARFSFGEPLPVLTHSLTDANLPGLAYDTLAHLLASRLAEAGRIIDPAYEPPPFTAGYREEDELRLLALVRDGTALYQEIARLSKTQGSDSAELADFLNQAGLALRRLARNAEAEPLYRRSLAICERLHGVEHAETAIRLNNLAQLLQDTNRLAEAEPLMRRALAIDEQSFGPDHPNVAIRLNNLAQLLQATNRLAEAEPLMRRALAIDEQSFGLDHPNVAVDLNNLAQLLKATNRRAEAEPLMRRALAIDEQSFGPDHPDVARDLNNLALLLKATNRRAEAEPLMRRALAIVLDFARRTGYTHPEQALCSGNYAALLRNLGKTEEEIRATLDSLGHTDR